MRSAAIVILALVFSMVHTAIPPTYNYSYHITFDETFTSSGTSHVNSGQVFYDPLNNRQRTDRTNGRYDVFCGTVLPDVDAPCLLYAVGGKRWVTYPTRNQCCFCCDSEHGCGPLRPDWLDGGEYLGTETVDGVAYDKWSKDGMVGYNHLWVNPNGDHVPRKLDEGGKHITDYHEGSFKKQGFSDSIFAFPAYCNTQTLVNCPLESICGKHRLSTN